MPGNPAPRYPRIARERGWQGRVILEVAIAHNGIVDRAEVGESSGYRVLDLAALQAVRRWRFAVMQPLPPAQGTMVRVPITFKLSD
ncbi:MAG: energy transducer TonB [Proteobacteria bacterium]|nr:energy transducer TonB [Pseudomonadota bacterium]